MADSTLVTFYINQAVHQRGGTTFYSNPSSITAGKRGRTPYYVVCQDVTFLDGLMLKLKF